MSEKASRKADSARLESLVTRITSGQGSLAVHVADQLGAHAAKSQARVEDFEFHQAIAQATQNPFFDRFFEQLSESMPGTCMSSIRKTKGDPHDTPRYLFDRPEGRDRRPGRHPHHRSRDRRPHCPRLSRSRSGRGGPGLPAGLGGLR
ncbi:FCD domain-containing protein [Halomonas stenophila]|uniref:FCD domain-containing protein n=1 Tax=Halomonas stenophila TaxID=795312 RepID=UPI0031B5D970